MNRKTSVSHAVTATLAHLPSPIVAEIFAALKTGERGNAPEACFSQWNINLTLSGSCIYSCNNRERALRPGSLLLCHPNVTHSWQVTPAPDGERQPWSVVYAVFIPRPHWHQWLNLLHYEDGVTYLQLEGAALARVRHGLLSATRLYQRSGMERNDWTMLAVERVLLQIPHWGTPTSDGADLRVRQAIRFMHDRFAQLLTVEDIAGAAHLSVTYFSRIFQRETGLTPMQYLEQVRLQRAEAMLRFGAAPIAEIAHATGFREPEYFSVRFKRATGQTPRDFRRAASTPPP